jgi:hypothetical protein
MGCAEVDVFPKRWPQPLLKIRIITAPTTLTRCVAGTLFSNGSLPA